MDKPSPHWSATTKTIVLLFVVVLLGLVVYRFRDVIPPLVIAFLLAFILAPIVDFLTNRLRLPRWLATTLVLLVVVAGLLGLLATPVAVVPSIQEAVTSAKEDVTGIINEIDAFLNQPPVEIMGYTFDLREYYQELSTLLRSFVASVAQGTVDIALSIASGVLWLIFILVTTFYLLKDADHIIDQVDKLPSPAYRKDFVRLRLQVTEVWHAFLRGQLVLGVVVGVITTFACWAVGLPYAGALGLLAGLLEVIPTFGPTIAAIPAILLALFQGSAFLPIGNFWFALLVTGVYILIQQLENNLLVPRILGYSLDLHPLLVLIAVVVGGSLGGILGMLLAAPAVGTLRVIGRYIFYRLQDRDPFAEPEEGQPSKPGLLKRAHMAVLGWLQKKRESSEVQDTEEEEGE